MGEFFVGIEKIYLKNSQLTLEEQIKDIEKFIDAFS